MNKRNEAAAIDLRKLFITYLRGWWMILLAALAAALVFFAYTRFFVGDRFQATTTIYVNNLREGDSVDSMTTGNLSASKQLVSTYISIVKSDRVLDRVSEILGSGYTTDGLKRMISAAQVADTGIFAISVTCDDPEEAAKVANVLADIVPEAIGALIDGSSARVIDYAKVPKVRSSPNYIRVTVVGALAGGLLVLLLLTLLFLTDVRIVDEEDLAALYDLPILGQIPKFCGAAQGGAYSYGGSAEAVEKKA